jgi:hypothetical protein
MTAYQVEIVIELSVIVALIILSLIVSNIPVNSEASKREKDWVQHLLSYLIFEIAGFTFFRSGIGFLLIAGGAEGARLMFYLITYQIVIMGDLIDLYIKGFTLNDDLKEAEDYSIESYLIHGILEVTLFGGMGLSLIIFILLLLIIYLTCIRGACSETEIWRTER